MLQVRNLKKVYKTKSSEPFYALNKINLDFPNKGFVFITGKSGSGKSTLLNVLGGLDDFTEGEIIIKGKSSKDFKSRDFDSYRNTYLGFVFQSFNLIEGQTIGKNIALALELQGAKKSVIKQKTEEILTDVGLLDKKNNKTNEISGGQKQRVAIARALVKNPEIIIADEPTGNLDSETSKIVMDFLRKLANDKLVIMVTHDIDYVAEYADRVIELRDGELIKDTTNKYRSLTPIMEKEVQGDYKKIIRLPKSRMADMTVLDKINASITDKDLYIGVTTSKDLINGIDAELSKVKSDVQEVKLDYTKSSDFKLIRSRLPMGDKIKSSLGNIWKKKFKLTMTLVLMVFGLFFFGMSEGFRQFNSGDALKQTIEDEVEYISILENRGEFDFVEIDKDGYKKVEDIFGKENVGKLYKTDIYNHVQNNSSDFFEEAWGASDLIFVSPDIEEEKTILQENENVSNGIYISDFYAKKVLLYYSQDENNGLVISNYEQLFEKYKLLDVYDIKGIYETKYEDYEKELLPLYEKQAAEQKLTTKEENKISIWEDSVRNIYSTHLSKDLSFMETDKIDELNQPDEFYLDVEYAGGNVVTKKNYTNFYNTSNLSKIKVFKDTSLQTEEDINELKDNEIILKIDSDYKYTTVVGDTVEMTIDGGIKTFVVKGFIDENLEFANDIVDFIVSEKTYNTLSAYREGTNYEPRYEAYSEDDFSTILFLNEDRDRIIDIYVENSSNYIVDPSLNSSLFEVEIFGIMIQSILGVFRNISIVVLALVAILVFNSITFSVLRKKKEIGTYRAIGAKGSDVSSIFVIEALIIAVTAGFISLFFVNMTNTFINGVVGDFISFDLLQLKPMVIFNVMAASVFISFIAAFAPIKKVTTMKPIDAIKG